MYNGKAILFSINGVGETGQSHGEKMKPDWNWKWIVCKPWM